MNSIFKKIQKQLRKKIKFKPINYFFVILIITIAMLFGISFFLLGKLQSTNEQKVLVEEQTKLEARKILYLKETSEVWNIVSRWTAIILIENIELYMSLLLFCLGISWIVHGVGFRIL